MSRSFTILAGPLLAVAVAQPTFAQSTERVSVSSSGAEANEQSFWCALSATGRWVVFSSYATNLVPGDTNGVGDVFVRDRLLGTTIRASVDSSGAQANNLSDYGTISADGRYVAFWSFATNLVPNDTNGCEDVFVRDLQLGTTIRVSVDSSGAQADSGSEFPSISQDGTRVVFASEATNLVSGDTNGYSDLFVRDLVAQTTVRVSVDSAGVQGNGPTGSNSALSADGRFATFWSWASNLVPGDTNGAYESFVHDLSTGATVRVNVDSSGTQGNAYSYSAAISADGRWSAFSSHASNLVPGDANATDDAFVHDARTGRTRCASLTPGGTTANGFSFPAGVSADGRFVLLVSNATNLAPHDANGALDVLVFDVASGIATLESVTPSGTAGNARSETRTPSLSNDGRFVAFFSDATDLVTGDTNGRTDVFVRDRFGVIPASLVCAGDDPFGPCPCSNAGEPWHGCASSVAASGALLLASGSARISLDTLRLDASRLPPTSPVLFFQGSALVNGGAGVAFGDGLRCVGGAIVRLGTRTSSAGSAALGAPLGDTPISVRGMVPSVGGTFAYQCWYRNAAAFCTASTFNLSNAVSVAWSP